jgi:pimeloyl-ACP methyl ester carboxylesterase
VAQEGTATVGDIEIAYRIQGRGEPLLLIMGLGGTYDIWDPTLLGELAQHYQVITFDNRGIGKTTLGTQRCTIPRFADDTAGLLEALGIDHASVLGWSLGSHVAQELVLNHPRRVDRLILYASLCGGREAIRRPETMAQFTDTSGGPRQQAERLLNLILPPEWVRDHLPYVLEIFVHPLHQVSQASIDMQVQAEHEWAGTWDRLGQISRPTLVITGTDDQATPPANSLILAERIPQAWLAYFSGGGHGMMCQYPQQFAATIRSFLQAP